MKSIRAIRTSSLENRAEERERWRQKVIRRLRLHPDVLDSERRILEEAARRKRRDKEAIWAVLGKNCPQDQRRLFLALADGQDPKSARCGSLFMDREVIGIVYKTCPKDKNKFGKLKRQLMDLAVVLNRRLRKRQNPCEIVWVDHEHLMLCGPREKKELPTIRESLLPRPPPTEEKMRAIENRALALIANSRVPKKPVGINECKQFVKDILGNGNEVPIIFLESEWDNKGGRPKTLRTALKHLEVKRRRKGFQGSSLISLP